MAEVDPKDVQAFNELQARLIDVTEKQKIVSYTRMLWQTELFALVTAW